MARQPNDPSIEPRGQRVAHSFLGESIGAHCLFHCMKNRQQYERVVHQVESKRALKDSIFCVDLLSTTACTIRSAAAALSVVTTREVASGFRFMNAFAARNVIMPKDGITMVTTRFLITRRRHDGKLL